MKCYFFAFRFGFFVRENVARLATGEAGTKEASELQAPRAPSTTRPASQGSKEIRYTLVESNDRAEKGS